MKSSSQNNESPKKTVNRFYVVVTIACVVSALFSIYMGAVEMKRLDEERVEIQVLIEEEEEKQRTLSNQQHYYESDAYIEKLAREKLGYVKPNDVVFIDKDL